MSQLANQPCLVPRLRADDAENAILKTLDEVLVNAGFFENLSGLVSNRASEDLISHQHMKKHFLKCLADAEHEIDSTFQLVSKITEGDAVTIIQERLNKAGKTKLQMQKNLSEIETKISTCKQSADKREVLSQKQLLKIFWRGWQKATPAQKKRLLRRVFDVIYAGVDGMTAHYWIYPENKEIDPDFSKQYFETKRIRNPGQHS